MHRIYKLAWAFRAVLYKPLFGNFGLPGYLGSPKFLMNSRRIFIGRRVRIFPGMRAECHGDGKLVMHDNISVGQDFHVICSGELHIGAGCLISGNVFITDTDHDFGDTRRPVHEQTNTISKTAIGENCFVGFGARIQAGTILGKGCVVGANAVVRGEFPPHSVIVGVPGRVIKRYNESTGNWERC